MNSTENNGLDEITFHLFLPWYLIKVGFLLLLSCIFITLTLRHHVFGGVGIVLILLAIIRLAAQYAAQKVIIRGNDLVLQTGLLRTNEYIVPIWHAELETPQSLLGRLFDYGAVRYQSGGDLVELRNVASIRALRFLVAERRSHLLTTLLERQVVMGFSETTISGSSRPAPSLHAIAPPITVHNQHR